MNVLPAHGNSSLMVSSKTSGFYNYPSVSQMTSMRQFPITDPSRSSVQSLLNLGFSSFISILLTSSLTNPAFNHFRLIVLFFLTFAPPAKRSQKNNIRIHSDPITKQNGENEGLHLAQTWCQQVLHSLPKPHFFF